MEGEICGDIEKEDEDEEVEAMLLELLGKDEDECCDRRCDRR